MKTMSYGLIPKRPLPTWRKFPTPAPTGNTLSTTVLFDAWLGGDQQMHLVLPAAICRTSTRVN
jgi:hypothetical protein